MFKDTGTFVACNDYRIQQVQDQDGNLRYAVRYATVDSNYMINARDEPFGTLAEAEEWCKSQPKPNVGIP